MIRLLLVGLMLSAVSVLAEAPTLSDLSAKDAQIHLLKVHVWQLDETV